MPNSSVETQKFAARLKLALATKGYKHSPTFVANKFNEVFQGRAINIITVRNWMLGKAIPTHDKLACLANLLDTSPEELRFGRSIEKTFVFDGEDLSAVDQNFLRSYLSLPIKKKRLIREMIAAVN
jgi:transcriptional regulator with XRE-family HTH domain